LKLLKFVAKYGEKFDRIGKTVDSIDKDLVVREWRVIKNRMRLEVVAIREENRGYTYT
jgi:hypothetical protein